MGTAPLPVVVVSTVVVSTVIISTVVVSTVVLTIVVTTVVLAILAALSSIVTSSRSYGKICPCPVISSLTRCL